MFLFTAPVLTTPLLKVPLIVSASIANHIGYTPPNTSRPDSEEQQKYGSSTLVTGTLFYYAGPIIKSISWAATLCEIAVIFASEVPSTTISNNVLTTLVIDRSSSASESGIHASPGFVLGSVLVTAGGFLRLWCYRTLGQFFTWDLAVRKDHRLVTSGPYSIIRHPSYLGAIMMSVGNILMYFSPGSWAVESGVLKTSVGKIIAAGFVAHWLAVMPIAVLRAFREDEVLRKEFGAEWQAWAQCTPYRVIPLIL